MKVMALYLLLSVCSQGDVNRHVTIGNNMPVAFLGLLDGGKEVLLTSGSCRQVCIEK